MNNSELYQEKIKKLVLDLQLRGINATLCKRPVINPKEYFLLLKKV